MLRRLSNVLTAISFLLLVVVAALWVRSYWVAERVELVERQQDEIDLIRQTRRVILDRGRLFLQKTGDWSRHNLGTLLIVGGRPPGTYWTKRPAGGPLPYARPAGKPRFERFGFRFYTEDSGIPLLWVSRSGGFTCRELTVPVWALALPLAVAPGLRLCRAAWAAARRRGRFHRGHCLGCGYDLAGNTSGVCPECGTPVTAGGRR